MGRLASSGSNASELLHQRVEILHHLALGIGIPGDDVKQHARALDVAQELKPKALALCCALDEAGDVGDHEVALVAAATTTPRLGTSVVNG